MIQEKTKLTLNEFVKERIRLNDVKDGIKVLDAPHLDIFTVKWI